MINPIVREFFRGLRERDELDVIVPELLTAMGFEVLSRPMVGTRQYGADVAAIGVDNDDIRKLFLFSIKRGDLNRQEWNGGSDQALRPSLDEIKDAYLRAVAPEHVDLPVVICITIGGVVLENVQPLVNGYMADGRTDRIEYRVWSGDTLTRKVVDGALREEVFPDALRTMLRKAAALVEEPEASLRQFAQLLHRVATDDSQEPIARVRILYLALWILTVWAREAGNLEAPYQASELVVLQSWELLWPEVKANNGRTLPASHALFEIVSLHLHIWDELYREKILPHAFDQHALSFAVGSNESIDINLALFETAGRVAMGGLWRAWLHRPGGGGVPRLIEKPVEPLISIASGLGMLPQRNPALFVPISEDQGIDVSLALMLLCMLPETRELARAWVQQTARAIMIAHSVGSRFPVTDRDYSTLIARSPSATNDIRKETTRASILLPLLAMVARALGELELVAEIGEFQTRQMAHCSLQVWVPNSRTEERLWRGDRQHGSSLGSLVVGADGAALMDSLKREVAANTSYPMLSTTELEHWPIFLLACRCYRLPPPPQLWMALLEDVEATPPTETPPGQILRRTPARRRVSLLSRAGARAIATSSVSR